MTDAAPAPGRNGTPGGELSGMDVRLAAYAFGHLSARATPVGSGARPLRARLTRRRAEVPAGLRRLRAGAGLGPDPSRLARGDGQPVHY